MENIMKVELNILARIDGNPAEMVSTLVIQTQEDTPLNEVQLDMVLNRVKVELLEKINQLNKSES